MNILLIKRGAIGDLLMATPLIRQIKQQLPCRLDLLVGKAAAIAVKDNPYLDRVIIVEDKDFRLNSGVRLASTMVSLHGDYDYVFVLDKHWYLNLQAKLVGGKTIGYNRDKISNLLLNKAAIYSDVSRYHCLYYLDLLSASGLCPVNHADITLDLTISQADKVYVNKEINLHNLEQFVVLVNSGGNNAKEVGGARMLPRDKIIALLVRLINSGKKVVLIGGKVDQENYAEYCSQLGQPARLFNWAGRFSLAQSAYLISLSEKFYTTDCGAMHLGVAMQMKERMLAFFGPTNPAHILPKSYLGSSAIWDDRAIFDPEYQLRGKVPGNDKSYFSTLDMEKLIL